MHSKRSFGIPRTDRLKKIMIQNMAKQKRGIRPGGERGKHIYLRSTRWWKGLGAHFTCKLPTTNHESRTVDQEPRTKNHKPHRIHDATKRFPDVFMPDVRISQSQSQTVRGDSLTYKSHVVKDYESDLDNKPGHIRVAEREGTKNAKEKAKPERYTIEAGEIKDYFVSLIAEGISTD